MQVRKLDTKELNVKETIKKIVSETPFMTPLPLDEWNFMIKKVNESVVTDIIQSGPTEMWNFAQYWKGMQQYDEHVKGMKIPADVIIEGTVPILDMMITMFVDDDFTPFNGGDGGSVRMIIFEDCLANIKRIIELNDLLIVGALVATATEIIFPLIIDLETNALEISSMVACATIGRNEYEKLWKNITNNAKETMLEILGMIVPAWYGMQLALLHPATETVFSNPVREKRDRKEQLKPVMINGKPKRVKYVRKHVITAEKGIYPALDNAMNNMYGAGFDKRKYTRRTYLWRVIGHNRETRTGVTWVKAHWKGPLKDFAKMAKVVPNNREIDMEGIKYGKTQTDANRKN